MADSDTAVKTERQLVIFNLADEVYGVDVGTVQAIIQIPEITHVPNTPDFVEGVINLRGKLIPVLDLRKRFGLAAAEQTGESRIVVVEVDGGSVGVVVDAVTEVLRIVDDSIDPASSIITTRESCYIHGIANLGERLIILLDLARVFSSEEQAALADAKAAAE